MPSTNLSVDLVVWPLKLVALLKHKFAHTDMHVHTHTHAHSRMHLRALTHIHTALARVSGFLWHQKTPLHKGKNTVIIQYCRTRWGYHRSNFDYLHKRAPDIVSFVASTSRLQGSDLRKCPSLSQNNPPSRDPEYLRTSAKAVYDSMRLADEDAVWVMQGWMFYHQSRFWQPAQVQVLSMFIFISLILFGHASWSAVHFLLSTYYLITMQCQCQSESQKKCESHTQRIVTVEWCLTLVYKLNSMPRVPSVKFFLDFLLIPQGLLSGVPDDKMIILDLFAESCACLPFTCDWKSGPHVFVMVLQYPYNETNKRWSHLRYRLILPFSSIFANQVIQSTYVRRNVHFSMKYTLRLFPEALCQAHSHRVRN